MPDLDLVVEGDGVAFGRRLAEETGGHLVVHAAFGTRLARRWSHS